MGRRMGAVLAAIVLDWSCRRGAGVRKRCRLPSGSRSASRGPCIWPNRWFHLAPLPPKAVAKGLIVPTKVTAVFVPAGALTKVDASNGNLVALTDIAAGDFVLASRFGQRLRAIKRSRCRTGSRALGVLVRPGPSGYVPDSWSHVVNL